MQHPRVENDAAPLGQQAQHRRLRFDQVVLGTVPPIPAPTPRRRRVLEPLVRFFVVRARQPRGRSHLHGDVLQRHEAREQRRTPAFDVGRVRMYDLSLTSGIGHQARQFVQYRAVAEDRGYRRSDRTLAQRLLQRLRDDIVAPAAEGYRQIASIAFQQDLRESLYGLYLPLAHLRLRYATQVVQVIPDRIGRVRRQHAVDAEHALFRQDLRVLFPLRFRRARRAPAGPSPPGGRVAEPPRLPRPAHLDRGGKKRRRVRHESLLELAPSHDDVLLLLVEEVGDVIRSRNRKRGVRRIIFDGRGPPRAVDEVEAAMEGAGRAERADRDRKGRQ